MRIGELAALVGVSTRTVRHYHHEGLLPEPPRLSNGYREYRLRDAVALARVRRLAELGLSLDEIRDVLADDEGLELREVLAELDADLARQQRALSERRTRLAVLLSETELHPDSTVSPEMAEVLRELPVGGSKFAALDRELLVMLDSAAAPQDRAALTEMFRPLTEPEALTRAQSLYARMDTLADAAPGDPRVAALAEDFAALLPDAMTTAAAEHLDEATVDEWAATMTDELSPAQAEMFRLLLAALRRNATPGGSAGNAEEKG